MNDNRDAGWVLTIDELSEHFEKILAGVNSQLETGHSGEVALDEFFEDVWFGWYVCLRTEERLRSDVRLL